MNQPYSKFWQSLNPAGLMYGIYTRTMNPSLLIPHFSVKDITKIHPERLRNAGFKGLIFDKDNTLTAPYEDNFFCGLKAHFKYFQRTFGETNVVILSNSVGSKDDLSNYYQDATRIEEELGAIVLKHKGKKPFGIKDVKEHFDCEPYELVMFGDRIFTDIAFGNRYNMLTVYTAPLSKTKDDKMVAKVRDYEVPLLKKLIKKGIKAPEHPLYDESICLEKLF